MWFYRIKCSQSMVAIDEKSLSEYEMKARQYLYDLSERTMKHNDVSRHYTPQDADESLLYIVKNTRTNMEKIKQKIEYALSNIQWNGSSVTIIVGSPPSTSSLFKEDWFTSVSTAEVCVGHQMAWGGVASFTFFLDEDGTYEVDDILDAGDDDFFVDSKCEQDYFMLVRALKNPKSLQSNRVVTVYTARPVSDRARYIDAVSVPSNIFVSNNYNHIEGLSIDLSGNRDIWKIRIEERYLIKTVDTGMIKEYQIVGGGEVPIKSISLIHTGES